METMSLVDLTSPSLCFSGIRFQAFFSHYDRKALSYTLVARVFLFTFCLCILPGISLGK